MINTQLNSESKIHPSGATCKGALQLEATFVDVKNMYFHWNSNPGLWSLVARACEWYSKEQGSSPGGDTCFHINKSCFQLAPGGVLTKASIAQY